MPAFCIKKKKNPIKNFTKIETLFQRSNTHVKKWNLKQEGTKKKGQWKQMGKTLKQ